MSTESSAAERDHNILIKDGFRIYRIAGGTNSPTGKWHILFTAFLTKSDKKTGFQVILPLTWGDFDPQIRQCDEGTFTAWKVITMV